jgi:hypothetical protein
VTRVAISTVRLVQFLEGGGHFWVYMQYVDALRRLGCEVVLIDSFTWAENHPHAKSMLEFERRLSRNGAEPIMREFERRLSRYGVAHGVVMTAGNNAASGGESLGHFIGMSESDARDLLAETDLLLNFNYHLHPDIVSLPKRSALVDIDPGLCQFWISRGYISPGTHDVYFTTGETVGARSDRIPDCGIEWVGIRPVVSLDLWSNSYDSSAESFTTVSTWWGWDYVGEPGNYYDNSKRAAFFPFLDLPSYTEQPLEVALYLTDGDEADQRMLEAHGWRVRHTRDVGGSPEAYRSYVQASRGEFSWAKRSCIEFQNAWVSDRTLCYLASAKPVVVQDTGPSSILPNGEGIFRFKTLADAVRALERVNADYERQCRLARSLAEEHFDATNVVAGILEKAL